MDHASIINELGSFEEFFNVVGGQSLDAVRTSAVQSAISKVSQLPVLSWADATTIISVANTLNERNVLDAGSKAMLTTAVVAQVFNSGHLHNNASKTGPTTLRGLLQVLKRGRVGDSRVGQRVVGAKGVYACPGDVPPCRPHASIRDNPERSNNIAALVCVSRHDHAG